jgi:hypothetical protein
MGVTSVYAEVAIGSGGDLRQALQWKSDPASRLPNCFHLSGHPPTQASAGSRPIG